MPCEKRKLCGMGKRVERRIKFKFFLFENDCRELVGTLRFAHPTILQLCPLELI